MVNNKLGLKIVRVSQGLTDLLPINEDKSWSKILWDIREDLKNIQNLSASSSVLMLTNIETGHLLTVASPIGGRPGDFICAWIYVPASINIAGRELVELINAIKFELRGNKCDEAKLTQLFSKSYEIAPAAKIVSKCSGNKNAYRYYGQGVAYTLSELLNDMCQSYYKDYKSIFLLDKTDGLVCSSCDDLSAKNVYSMIVVKSPGTIDSFVPYIAGEPFTGQKYAIEGDTIDIEWRKSGYRSIHTITSVTKDMQYSRPTPNQYVRVIPFGSIQVVDEISRPIREYQIYVANREVKPGNPFEVSESTINNVPVEIIVDGYKPFSQNIDLTQAVRVKMVKETYSYEYMLPLKHDGDYCPIKISGKKKETGSPVKGYVLETKFSPNHPNYLRFEPLNRRFWIVCAVVALILLGAGFWIGYAVAGPEKTDDAKKTEKAEKAVGGRGSVTDKDKKPEERDREEREKEKRFWENVKDVFTLADNENVLYRIQAKHYDATVNTYVVQTFDVMNRATLDSMKLKQSELKNNGITFKLLDDAIEALQQNSTPEFKTSRVRYDDSSDQNNASLSRQYYIEELKKTKQATKKDVNANKTETVTEVKVPDYEIFRP